MNLRLDSEQAFKRKALRDLPSAWGLCVAIIVLSSGLLKFSTAYDWYRRDRRAWDLHRAPPTRLGAS
jgi:hypothetical protein